MSAGLSDELWVLSTTRMEWTLSIAAGESPSARVDHAMTASGNNLYLFGGGAIEGEGGSVRLGD